VPQSAIKRKLRKRIQLLWPVILAGLVIFILMFTIRLILPIYRFAKENNLNPQLIASLIFGTDSSLKKDQERTNVLILGSGGSNHEGTDLTDTMVLVSINTAQKDAVMISIPRDLWVPSLMAKINSSYHYGEEKKEGGGLILAKAAVKEVFGQPVHYVWLIDFDGFTAMIDIVGGIDVVIEKSFEDNYYPIPGKENDECGGDPNFACRYEHLRFESGIIHMDGGRALKYVRSRNAIGAAGNDFDRSRRQQQVIVAFKDKILKSVSWRNRQQIKQLLDAFSKSTQTDMNWSEQILFFKFFLGLPDDQIRKVVLDTSEKGFLVNPPLWEYKGTWVLVPRTGNFGEIQEYISCQLKDANCPIKP